jgi:WD40 repeat protein
VWVWDANTGEQLRELQGHTGSVNSIAFSPDGNKIVSGSFDHSVRVWDVKTGKQLRELQGHTGSVTSVAFSPDGNKIVSGSEDQSVQVWDAEMDVLRGHTSYITSVAFLPDSDYIVSGSGDQSAHVSANSGLDSLWVMDEDGWIISDTKHLRLIWIPVTIRNVLHHPHNILIISRNCSATISFEYSKLGSIWHECYTP